MNISAAHQTSQTNPLFTASISPNTGGAPARAASTSSIQGLPTSAERAPDDPAGRASRSTVDRFEQGDESSSEAQRSAHLRRIAAQQQTLTLAPPQGTPPGTLEPVQIDSTEPTIPSPQRTPHKTTDGAVDRSHGVTDDGRDARPTFRRTTPVATPKISSAADAAEATDQAPPPSGVKLFTSTDRDHLLEIFGSTKGNGAYEGAFDLNADGVIDGADLAALLSRFTEGTSSSLVDPATMSQQEIVSQVLSAFGAHTESGSATSAFDFNGDGVIDGADLASALAGARPVAPPSTDPSDPSA